MLLQLQGDISDRHLWADMEVENGPHAGSVSKGKGTQCESGPHDAAVRLTRDECRCKFVRVD